MNGIRHEKYTGSMNGLPFYLGVDIKRSRYNLSNEQNLHENLEIELFTEGEGTVLLNGEKINVKKDDIIVVNSNVLHYTFTDSNLVYTCIIISDEWCKSMNIDYNSFTFHSLVKSPELKKNISELVSVFRDTEDSLRTLKLNEILIRIMTELIKNHCDLNTQAPAKSKGIEAVTATIEYIHKNFSKKIKLSEIAKVVLFDKYALCREFKKHTGQTIFEYINHYRAVMAADLLLKENTITHTAELCGFENLSFFTKTFKKYIGTTPSEYKKSRL